MAKRSVAKIIDAYHKAQSIKAKWDVLYEDVFKYGMPGRYTETRDLSVRKLTGGETERKELYTSVMEQSCGRFVQRVQQMLTPVGVDWIAFEAGYRFTADGRPADDVNRELGKIAKILNVFKDTSNFDSVVTEGYYDLIAGTMCLSLLEGTPDNPYRFAAIPFKDYCIEEGLYSEPCAFYRRLKIKRSLINAQWKDAKDVVVETGKEDEEIELIECTYKDYESDTWLYTVIDETSRAQYVERVYITCPFIVLRWEKCAGELYGRGLGLKAVSDVKTLNRVVEYSLRNLALSVPVFLAQSGDGYDPTTFRLAPGAVNPVPSTATNNPTIMPLTMNQQPDLSAYHAEQLEMNIKRSLLDDTIPNDPSRQLTATEIAHRAEELQANFSNSFGRIQSEFMYPLIRRMIEVAESFGYLDKDAIDPRDFNGFGYRIKITTVLAKGQRAQEVQNTIAALQAFAALDPNMQLMPKVVKLDQLVPDLMRKMGIDPMFIATAEEVRQAQMNEAQTMQAMADADAERQMAIDTNKEQVKHDVANG